jgi:NTE family protein
MNTEKSRARKTVSLVLGSGGARGLAHIGVIRWLEEHDYEIRSVSGCSIGALIGGVYAAGELETFTQWVRAIKAVNVVSLFDFSLNKAGLVRGDKIINTLKELIGDRQIEDLAIRFTAVATDIRHRREVWLDRGSLFDAIRASISLPLFFTPVTRGDCILIDGGVLNPVPIAPTFSDQTDITIAINLEGASELYQDLAASSATVSAEKTDASSYFEKKANNFIRGLLTANAKKSKDISDWSYYDIVHQAFDTMQGTIARQKLAAYPPDVLIEIAANQCSVFEFDRADELIELGYQMARRQLGQPYVQPAE